eukprot:TRINITY_DN1019_c3_g1_i1.p1 TRINITY_DN1019_c3_g1~~TRINITY_DN1019_c3_g1_i1.p1  ORF type:complete len:202 (+),score=42.24 TRINITY_DN1019_c3_g1_i1:63-668(+)
MFARRAFTETETVVRSAWSYEQEQAHHQSSCGNSSDAGLSDSHSEGHSETPEPEVVIKRDSIERPCPHNQWTKQTKKRGKLVLRCNVCQCVWKMKPELHTKCSAFHNGKCLAGDNCVHPHIYARRENASLARRKARIANAEAAYNNQMQAYQQINEQPQEQQPQEQVAYQHQYQPQAVIVDPASAVTWNQTYTTWSYNPYQ